MTSPEILQPVRWPAACGPLTEEAVRALHLPNYRHRFSVEKYPSGAAFPGRQSASTRYVLSGSCEFTFGEQSITLGAGDFAALPAGDYTFQGHVPWQCDDAGGEERALAVRCVGRQYHDLAAVAPRPHVEDDANARHFAGVKDDQVTRLHTLRIPT